MLDDDRVHTGNVCCALSEYSTGVFASIERFAAGSLQSESRVQSNLLSQ